MQNNIWGISNRLYRLAISLESQSNQNKNESMEQNESREQNESIDLKQHEKNCQNEVTAPQELSPR